MIRTTRAGLSPFVLTVAAVAAAAPTTAPAKAGVTQYFLFTTGGFVQNGPNDLEFFGGLGAVGIGGEGSGQLDYAEVARPSGGTLFTFPPNEYPDVNDPNRVLFTAQAFQYGPDVATPALIDEKYGPGKYEFLIHGGALDGLSDSMTADTGFRYVDQSPRVLPSSYALLAGGGDRGLDLPVEWSGFNLPAGIPTMGTLLLLDDLYNTVADFDVDLATGQFVLPAGTLKNGDHYFLALRYAHHADGRSANGVATAADNLLSVFVDLKPAAAVPEPATLAAAALGLALLPLARRRAKRR